MGYHPPPAEPRTTQAMAGGVVLHPWSWSRAACSVAVDISVQHRVRLRALPHYPLGGRSLHVSVSPACAWYLGFRCAAQQRGRGGSASFICGPCNARFSTLRCDGSARYPKAPMRWVCPLPQDPQPSESRAGYHDGWGSGRAGTRGRPVGGRPCRRSGRQPHPRCSVGLSEGAENLVKLDDDRSLRGMLTTTDSIDTPVRGLSHVAK